MLLLILEKPANYQTITQVNIPKSYTDCKSVADKLTQLGLAQYLVIILACPMVFLFVAIIC